MDQIPNDEAVSNIVVIDQGSYSMKVGKGSPRGLISEFPPIAADDSFCHLGRFTYAGEIVKMDILGSQRLDRPRWAYDGEYVSDFEAISTAWRHAVEDIAQVIPEEARVFFGWRSYFANDLQKKFQEFMFEDLGVASITGLLQSSSVTFMNRNFDCVYVDCGASITSVLPIIGMVRYSRHTRKLPFGGNFVSKYLTDMLLSETSMEIPPGMKGSFLMDEMKEKLCYASAYQLTSAMFDLRMNFNNNDNTNQYNQVIPYQFPDGSTVNVGTQRFRCIEPYFNPQMAGIEAESLPDMIVNCIMSTDPSHHATLFSNIVLVGGSSIMPGFVERLEQGIRAATGNSIAFSIAASPSRKYDPFLHGSHHAQRSPLGLKWTTKSEYLEGSSYDEASALLV